MKKAVSILLITAVLIGLSGCGYTMEIENYAIIAGAAFDCAENDQIMLTIEVVNTAGGKAEEPNDTFLFTGTADTITVAAENIMMQMGKPLYWSHAEILILSRQLCQDSIRDIVNWVIRSRAPRIAVPIVASIGRADEILSAKINPFTVTSFGLHNLLVVAGETGIAVEHPVYLAFNRLEDKSRCVTIPLLDIIEDNPKLVGSAVIFDYKYICELNVEQTYAGNILAGETRQGIICTEDYAFNVNDISTKKKVDNTTGVCSYTIKLSCSLEQGDVPEDRGQIDRLIDQKLQNDIWELIELSRELEVDFLQINSSMYETAGKNYTYWPPSKLNMTVSTEIHIYDYGQVE